MEEERVRLLSRILHGCQAPALNGALSSKSIFLTEDTQYLQHWGVSLFSFVFLHNRSQVLISGHIYSIMASTSSFLAHSDLLSVGLECSFFFPFLWRCLRRPPVSPADLPLLRNFCSEQVTSSRETLPFYTHVLLFFLYLVFYGWKSFNFLYLS